MKKDITLYLNDIIKSISHIELYIKNVQQTDFSSDDFLQDAVIRRFEIIGEAAKCIPEDFRQKYPDIPWRLATGMRDILIHEYNEINFDRLWKTIKEDLPRFKEQIQLLLLEKH